MAGGIRDLKVWQEAVALAADVVNALRQRTRRETKVISDQVMTTAVSVAALIAEGYGHYAPPEQRGRYRAARCELLRLETMLAIARGADLLSSTSHAALSQRIQSVARLVGGYLVYLERQAASDEPSSGSGVAAAS